VGVWCMKFSKITRDKVHLIKTKKKHLGWEKIVTKLTWKWENALQFIILLNSLIKVKSVTKEKIYNLYTW